MGQMLFSWPDNFRLIKIEKGWGQRVFIKERGGRWSEALFLIIKNRGFTGTFDKIPLYTGRLVGSREKCMILRSLNGA